MAMIDDRPVICDPEPVDTEALFKEAKRRERRRRLGFAGIAVLIATGAVIAETIGGGGQPRASRGDLSGPRSGGAAPAVRLWSQTPVVKVMLADSPVALSNSPFAYGITVASTAPTSPWGWLTRIDLANGQEIFGPRLPAGSSIFVLGALVAVLSPSDQKVNGLEIGPWSIRTVVPGSVSFGHTIRMRGRAITALPLTVSQGPLVGHNGLWFGSGESLSLIDSSTGAVEQSETLGAPITGISVDPTGDLVYVGLDELAEHPQAKVSSVVDELDATTGRMLSRAGFDFTLGSIGVEAVRGGVWVSYRSGMAGSAYLLRTPGLAVAHPPERETRLELRLLTGGTGPAIGGIWPTPVGSTLWVTSGLGVGCVAPSSGVFLAGTAFPKLNGQAVPWRPFADWHGHVYATEESPLTGANEIVSVTAPRVCR